MRYVAAYLLAVLGGKENPNGGDIEKILGSVGIEADQSKLDKVISELNGKNIDQLIEEGKGKLASMPSGGGVVSGGGGGVAAAAPSGGGSAPAAAKEVAKKEEVKEEESDEDLGFGLFD